MQNVEFDSRDEVEPRTMPKPASKFDSLPFPTVPEVSLIMDKPQLRKMNDSLLNTKSEIKSSIPRESVHRMSESYAAWKEKQFPQSLSRTSPNPGHYNSSIQYSNKSQNTHIIHSQNECHMPLQEIYNNKQSVETSDYNLRNQKVGKEFQKKYTIIRGPDQLQNSDKRDLVHSLNNTIDYPASSTYECLPRYHNRDIKISPNNRGEDYIYDSEGYNYKQRYNADQSNNSNQRRHLNYLNDSENFGVRQILHNQDKRHPNIHRRQSDNLGSVDDFSNKQEFHNINQRINSNESSHTYASDICDIRHKSRVQRSSSYSNIDSHLHRSPIGSTDYIQHSPSVSCTKHSPEGSHCYSGCCSSNYNNSNTDAETVKNLLQVITSQNEQIKNLQKQVERLLKLHEHNMKQRSQCNCQSNGIIYQNAQIYDKSRTSNLPITHKNLMKDNDKCFSDLQLQDEKTKQTILEQKVSIGVMTSFELKVQNNPSLLGENDIKQKNMHERVKPNLDTSNMIKNLVNDTGEMIRKKQNLFNPTVLENISEGSESHISSLRQSHLGPDSTRQSMEHDYIELEDTAFNKLNIPENESIKKSIEHRKELDIYNKNSQSKSANQINSKTVQPIYENTECNIQEIPEYEYNFQYPNLGSKQPEGFLETKSDEFYTEPLNSDFIKTRNTKSDNVADDCLSLSGSELDLDIPSPPSPEPSIHLDLQEFSSEGGSLPPQKTQKVGWTLYNNVLDQVNQILQNAPDSNSPDEELEESDGLRKINKKECENNVIMDTVKAATIEQLTKLGISFSDKAEQKEPNYNKKVVFDASYYSRQGPETHITATSGSFETNTSMHMKALAMKYLNDEQLGDIAMQKPRPGVLKQVPTNVQNTNMSFATMHYLQRYHLLPGTHSPAKEAPRKDYIVQRPILNERMGMKPIERQEPSPNRYSPFKGTPNSGNCPSKILDISTLKQQPKLL